MKVRLLIALTLCLGVVTETALAQVGSLGSSSSLTDKIEKTSKPEARPQPAPADSEEMEAPQRRTPRSRSRRGRTSPDESKTPVEMKPADAATVEPDALDRTDAKLVAEACLVAYQKPDFDALSRLSTGGNQDLFDELAKAGEDHPRYESITSGFRWESVSKWKRTDPLTVRYRGANTAVVEFGASRDESFVVMLEWENDQWCFEDINSPSRDAFRELPRQRE
ncbi:hypothetical protein [Rubinisphaera margarita]|uniref:hypothetical protein n=1 Tax=Rubinisphaera margarita TaxID=2909586 RepID=UPI001EE89FE9|nr:hypothetical protein [Rubinisphaera margarita]MCG6157304.1 hypothetical protein [Rubinisphaera margarita]